MAESKTLIIWLKNGNTCKFEQVEQFYATDDKLEFDYFGVSTQVKREATFLKNNIAGYAFEI